MTTADLNTLRSRLTFPRSLVTDLTDFGDYFHDATEHTNSPLAIVFPEDLADVVATVRFCHEHSIPLTPRGAGTGLSGGCVPSEGALLLSTEKMTELEIDPQSCTAVCGPGVVTKMLQDEAARFNLTYPPDPASYEECTLGGNVAEGAGGLRCKRYGVTKDYVIGLEAVTADAQVLRTGVLNSGRGFSLGDLLVASEGTLAVITRIVVRLIPLPGRGVTLLAAFDSPTDAARTVSEITASGMIPTVLEYIDGDTVKLANEYSHTEGIDRAAAVLLLETSDRESDHQRAAITRICESNHASYLRAEADPDRAETLWQVRRNVSNAAKEAARVKVSEDVAVPNGRFPELVAFVAERNRASELRINSYGHAGDGNLHVNFLAVTDSPAERAAIDREISLLMQKAVDLGGTLSGEHGIGLVKRAFMGLEFDESTLAAMLMIRDVFDPHRMLNPGKIFPEQNY